ncbi:MAG: ketopantoate reductase family protein [Firmicutes bacterium]|nr:ketopantoate reductase family protein [Alicyclobacillaceae bacterium]MCL6496212.1 ketopantoate reductase family protein [Bacillota bacterium]
MAPLQSTRSAPIGRVAVVGLGALGTVYASRIHACDPEALWVVLDPIRRAHYPPVVWVNQTPYEFRYATPEEVPAPVDLVLLTVKQHHLDRTLEEIAPLVGATTQILPLQNGLFSEEVTARAFGWERVLYAFAVGIDALRQERTVTYSQIGQIVYGERQNRPPSPRVARVAAFFDRVGIPYDIPEDMLRALWWKFMINVGINQTSALLQAPYGVFQRVPAVRAVMEAAMAEVVAVAEREGIGLRAEDIVRFREVLARLQPEGKTSMLQDIEAGRKTEVDILADAVVALGRRHGVPTPLNEAFAQLLRALEAMRGVG